MEDYKKKYERAFYDLEIIKNANKDNKELVAFIEHEYPELKESEDERIRRDIIRYLKKTSPAIGENIEKMLAWLEKPKYTEEDLDKAYKCADEVQYRRGYEDAKKEIEKQGEREHVVVVPRFRVDDTIRPKGSMAEYTIESIYGECYHGKGWGSTIGCDEDYELVEQKSTWSEEDEMFVHGLIRGLIAKRDIHGHTTFSSDYINITEAINWLKSLKNRMKGE